MRSRRPSRTFLRYVALEAPGWLVAGILLWLLVQYAGLAPWIAWLLGSAWIAKDFALYPWLRDAYEASDPDPGAALVGRTGLALERLAPEGYVRLGSERWRARLGAGCDSVEPGARVSVRSVSGLTLTVEPLEPSGKGGERAA
jgi:membrane protein implicated in regulation of membrane protease activity